MREFQKSFYRQNLGWRLQGAWLSSDSWWWGNRWFSRNLVLNLKLASSTWRISSCRGTQRYIVIYFPSGGTRILLYCSTIVSWLTFLCFCIPSRPWVVTVWTVWICLLELREYLRSWSLFLQTQEGGHGKAFVPRKDPWGCAWFEHYTKNKFIHNSNYSI